MQKLSIIALWAFSIFMFSQCQTPIEYSPIPEIEFDSISWETGFDELGNESKQVLFSLQMIDGDGNIGLQDGDTIGPFNQDSAYYYNLFITLYEKKDGEYQEIQLAQPHYFRVPYYEPVGINKTVKATIEVEWFYPLANIADYDTLKYDAVFYDRDLNKSNLVVSPDVIVQVDSFYVNQL